METITVKLSSDINLQTIEWITHASPKNLSLAIELGYPTVDKIEDLALAKAREYINMDKQNKPSELPVAKGQVGESFIEDILVRKFGSVANVAKNPKSGDLTLYIQHNKITVEVKNYNNPVPTSGVEKFRRDLNTTNARGGIFISLKSPITSVTSDFTIKYEHCDTLTIPCAYIVSSDENAIIIAVNMISQIISSTDYINAEMYNRDRVICNVYDIAGKLDDLSKIRNDLQVEIGTIMNSLSKTTLGLVVAESNIRNSIDKIKSELFYTQLPDIVPALVELNSNPNFMKYSVELRGYIVDVMKCIQCIQHIDDITGCAWKLSAKKCSNTVSGISFNFLAAKIEVQLPRSKVSNDLIIKSLDTFGKKVNISDSFCIDLDAITFPWICKVIKNEL